MAVKHATAETSSRLALTLTMYTGRTIMVAVNHLGVHRVIILFQQQANAKSARTPSCRSSKNKPTSSRRPTILTKQKTTSKRVSIVLKKLTSNTHLTRTKTPLRLPSITRQCKIGATCCHRIQVTRNHPKSRIKQFKMRLH